MMRQMGILSQALLVGLSITAISIGVGLLVPIPDQGRGGSSGAECALMAQALRAVPEQYRIIASDRSCSWRRLGISNAISAEALPPEARMPNRSVMSPRYSLFGYKAELDVGVTLAELAVQEKTAPTIGSLDAGTEQAARTLGSPKSARGRQPNPAPLLSADILARHRPASQKKGPPGFAVGPSAFSLAA